MRSTEKLLFLDETNPYTISRKISEDISEFKLTSTKDREGTVKCNALNFPIEYAEDAVELFETIALIMKAISSKLKMPALHALYASKKIHSLVKINASGDKQKNLDVISNELVKNLLRTCKKVCIIVSEEEESYEILNEEGEYVLAFDPLDGSSNLDCNVSVGTIISIWRRKTTGLLKPGPQALEEVLRPGKELYAACYGFYGASTLLVTAFAGVVNGFTLDTAMSIFILSHPDIKVPKEGKYYSCNEANSMYWDRQTLNYVKDFKNKPKTSLRYIGSMVSDLHRTLLYGGIFFYPSDTKNKNGKLRLLYECAPMAFIFKTAGGFSISGSQEILEITPSNIHQRTGIFIGSIVNVKQIHNAYLQEQ